MLSKTLLKKKLTNPVYEPSIHSEALNPKTEALNPKPQRPKPQLTLKPKLESPKALNPKALKPSTPKPQSPEPPEAQDSDRAEDGPYSPNKPQLAGLFRV